MKPIRSSEELKQAIAELERKTKVHEVTVKGDFNRTKEALKPQNFVRNSFSSLAAIPEVRKTLVSTIIGFGIGYFSKKATQAMSENSLNRLVGGLVEHGLDRLVKQNPQGLLAQGIHLTRHVAREKGIHLF